MINVPVEYFERSNIIYLRKIFLGGLLKKLDGAILLESFSSERDKVESCNAEVKTAIADFKTSNDPNYSGAFKESVGKFKTV